MNCSDVSWPTSPRETLMQSSNKKKVITDVFQNMSWHFGWFTEASNNQPAFVRWVNYIQKKFFAQQIHDIFGSYFLFNASKS